MDELKNNTSEDLSKNLDGNKKTLDRVCADLFKKLKDTDLDEVALRSGAYITGNLRLGLLYFGSDIVVDLESDSIYYKEEPADSRINDLKKLDIFSSAVILHYLVNADGTRSPGNGYLIGNFLTGCFISGPFRECSNHYCRNIRILRKSF